MGRGGRGARARFGRIDINSSDEKSLTWTLGFVFLFFPLVLVVSGAVRIRYSQLPDAVGHRTGGGSD